MFGIDTWGLDVVLWFQEWRTPFIESVALVFHQLGQVTPYLLILPIVYWCVERRFGARLVVWFVAGFQLNNIAKILFDMPRPYNDPSNGVKNLTQDALGGMPSGHAQMAVTFWGMVAAWARKRWVWVVAVLYALLMGISRVVAGVHYPQDVIGGWLIGIVWLALYLTLDRPLTGWLGRLPLWAQIVLGAGLSLGTLALAPTEFGGTAAGALAGLVVGLALAEKWARFDARGDLWRRVVRYVIGIVGVFALQAGLDVAFEGLSPPLAWRVLRYALVGLWMALGAPAVFLRTGLAAPEKPEVI
jgi:membrane-associated phospholipid phosphatase